MATLTRAYLQNVEGLSNVAPSSRKRSLKSILGCLAIGQILREEYVYEVHGPFRVDETEPPQPRLAAWMIARLAAASPRGKG